MLPIDSASAEEQGWRALAPPSLRVQIDARIAASARPPIVRIARMLGGAVAGCVCVQDDDDQGELLLLTTVPAMRRRGLASSLLAAVEQDSAQRGIGRLVASWSDAPDAAGPAGDFFAKAGWAPATRGGIAMTMSATSGDAFVSGLADRLPPCPHAFVRWCDLDQAQRDRLRAELARGARLADGLDPFRLEALASADLSFAIVGGDGRVLGWHIATWAAPDRAWVLAGYGLPEALGGACFLRLWAVFFRQAALRSPQIACGWDTHASQGPMMRFLLRREGAARPTTQGRWTAQRRLERA